MENRGQQYHRGRMAEAMREEIVALVEGELGDPRIGLVSVSEVHMAPDGKTARVFVTAAGDEDEAAAEPGRIECGARVHPARTGEPAGHSPGAGNRFRARPLGPVRRADRRVAATNSEEKALGSDSGP